MATYSQIREWVQRNHGWTIQHDCWIAHCKELAGLNPRRAWNRSQPNRSDPCPPDRQPAIIAAFRHFGMLPDD